MPWIDTRRPAHGSRERDLVYWAEPEVAALAIDGEAHGPALAAARFNFEVETATIRVPAGRRDVFDRGSRETMDALGIMLGHEIPLCVEGPSLRIRERARSRSTPLFIPRNLWRRGESICQRMFNADGGSNQENAGETGIYVPRMFSYVGK